MNRGSRLRRWVVCVACIGGLVGCSGGAKAEQRSDAGQSERATPPSHGDLRIGTTQTGKASWYGGRFHGRKTASGERFDKNALTAAHRTLPFGTVVRVTNMSNQRQVLVRINDRGPFGKKTRIIDVSEKAADKLNMRRAGVVPVTIKVVQRPPPRKRHSPKRSERAR